MEKDKMADAKAYPTYTHASAPSYFEITPLAEYLEARPEERSHPHAHDYFQIIWFKSGSGNHQVDFHSYNVFDNAIFFIGKNQAHAFDAEVYDGFVISFSESFIVQKDTDVDFFLKCSMFNNPFQQPSCCVGSGREYKLDEYIAQMQAELNEPDYFGQEELLRLYLKAFLIQIQRRRIEIEEIAGSTAPFVVDDKKNMMIRFVNLVEDNYSTGLTVAEYASRLHISTRTLSDLTLQLVKKTPSAIIQDRIILEAKRLLLHSAMQVNEIAYRLGFSDSSYFVKYFRKHTHMTPSNFRNILS